MIAKSPRLWLLFFLFPFTASGLEPVSLKIGEVSFGPWQLQGVVLNLMPSAGYSSQRLVAQIEKLVLPQPFGDLSRLQIRCTQFFHAEDSTRCQSGQLTAITARFGPVKADFSFNANTASGTLKVNLLQSFFGRGSIIADWQKEQWSLRAKLNKDNVKSLKAFLSRYVDLSELSGRVELSGRLQGQGEQLRSFALEVRTKALSSQTVNDRFATEQIDLQVDVEGRFKNDWRLKGKILFKQGALYTDPGVFDPIFFNFTENPLKVSMQGSWLPDSSNVRIDQIDIEHEGVVQLSGRGDFDLPSGRLQRGEIKLKSLALSQAFSIYIAPSLEETDLEGLGLTGKVQSDFIFEGGSLFRFHSVFSDVAVTGKQDRFRLEDADGELFWQRDGDSPPSDLSWGKALLYRIPMESGQMTFLLEPDGLVLTRGFDLFLLDGLLRIDSFKLAGIAGDTPEVSFTGRLAGISLPKLTEALSWPSLDGEVAGTIPGVSYHKGTLELDGQLSIQVFDGKVELTDLAISHLLKGLPILTTTAKFRHIDLAALTRTFSFGSIEGRLDGDIDQLYLENWRPIAFNAWFATPKQDDKRHRISQTAVENITSLGGGPTGILSKGVMRFFDSFAYDRIGVGCRLREGACEMKGIEPVNGGYYLVKGRSLPRIDMIGYNRRIDWNVLLQRLKRVVGSDQAVVR